MIKRIILIQTILCLSVVSSISAGAAIGSSTARTSPRIIVNGEILSSGGAFIENGTTYVPLRLVSEALGAQVGWDGGSNTVSIALDASSGLDSRVSDVIRDISPSVVAIVGNYGEAASSYQRIYAEGMALGTGVVIKSGGEILTNAHVVDGLRNILVILHDGNAYKGTVRFFDRESDLAVVRINKIGLPIVTFADSDNVKAGDTVVTIGTPLSFSLRNSASKGIISGINRGMLSEYALIQTDAAINPGNSGGPLVNLSGQVVGINSIKYVGLGVERLGFSIPANTVKFVLNQFEEYGEVRRANISATLDEGWAARYGLPTKDGLRVISSSGITQSEGLSSGDLVLAIDGVEVHSKVDFNECMKNYRRGEGAEFKIRRGTEERLIRLTLI